MIYIKQKGGESPMDIIPYKFKKFSIKPLICKKVKVRIMQKLIFLSSDLILIILVTKVRKQRRYDCIDFISMFNLTILN